MKRNLWLLFCMVITLTLLSGCTGYDNINSAERTENTAQSIEATDWESTTYNTVNNFADVTMTARKGTVSSTGLTVVFENKSDNQCIYGEHFLLEKKINEKWYQVPVVIEGNYGFDGIGHNLPSGSNGEWEVNWNWLYGSLETGKYRVVKNILDFRGTGDYDKYYLAAEFTI